MGLEEPLATCRLSVLLARNAPVAIVLRRGPTKWVQLVKWQTDCDRFETGQWFKGRVYDRRSDLSPDGSLFIYFANKINARTVGDSAYTYAWTAISHPPYFTALALWPKGDCWHGGGLFLGRSRCPDDSGSYFSSVANLPLRSSGCKPGAVAAGPREHNSEAGVGIEPTSGDLTGHCSAC